MKLTPSAQVVRRYQAYGLMGGIALGLLTGVLVSGPHFQEWPASRSLMLIVCCAAGGAVIGWALLALAAGLMGGTVASDYDDLREHDQDNHESRGLSATTTSDDPSTA